MNQINHLTSDNSQETTTVEPEGWEILAEEELEGIRGGLLPGVPLNGVVAPVTGGLDQALTNGLSGGAAGLVPGASVSASLNPNGDVALNGDLFSKVLPF